MSSPTSPPPDRAKIAASLRDYVEQMREEGMEGLPASRISFVATRASKGSYVASNRGGVIRD